VDMVINTIVDESFRTVIALATTTIAGGIVWLVTLRVRSNRVRTLVSDPRRKFDLYYRGDSATEHHKRICFNRDGSIGGEQKNTNEHQWLVRFGLLEMYSASGVAYSKFKWDKTTGKLRHINNPKLPSVTGQYIVPVFIPPNDPVPGATGT